jgi:hypothetical protein
MNTSYITRPVRQTEYEIVVEDFPEKEYHAPYLHEGCQQCEAALLETINEGIFEQERDLLPLLNKNFFDEKDIVPFDLYRHFHPQYAFTHAPYQTIFKPVALPRKRLLIGLCIGDIILLRNVLSGQTYQAVITGPELFSGDPTGNAVNVQKKGYYVQGYGNTGRNKNETVAVRIADRNMYIPNNIIILRRATSGSAEPPSPIFSPGRTTNNNAGTEREDDPTTPNLINRETTPPAETLYVNIDLGLRRECSRMNEAYECIGTLQYNVEPKTGIFIPANFTARPQIDVLLYLHGFKRVSHGRDLPIDRYWNAAEKPMFAFRELLNASGRNFILVAPTLGPFSQAGTLMTNSGFTAFINQVVAAIAQHSTIYSGQPAPTVRSIILACHSGGGKIMRRIARIANNPFTALIRECWGFDCTYGGRREEEWYDWANSNPDKSLYLFSRPGSTANNAALIQHGRVPLPNIILAPSQTADHNSVPRVHMAERLAAVTGLGESYTENYTEEGNTFCTDWGVMVPETQVRQQIANTAVNELQWWQNGGAQILENTAAGRARITSYWSNVPGTPAHTVPATAWSGVFVSTCIKLAADALGITPVPLYLSAGHFHYARAAYNRRFHNPPQAGYYWAYDPADRVVQVGDIIVKERRQQNGRYLGLTFNSLATMDGASTHGDIVTAIQTSPARAIVVGGNVSNSVNQNDYVLTADGKIDTTQAHYSATRVFAVLSLEALPGCILPPVVPSRDVRSIA